MYSLGIVMIEIAHWKCIDSIIAIPEELRAARKTIASIRRLLLEEESRRTIEVSMGENYSEALRRCLIGTDDLSIDDELVESCGDAAADLQQVFYDQVIKRLNSIII